MSEIQTNDGVRRVLMTADTVGGVWTFAMELAGALARQGVDTILATLGGEASKAQRTEAAAIPGLQLLTSKFKLEWMRDPWKDVEQSGEWLLSIENECAPDVVHLNSYGHGVLPWRTPVVLTAHSCVASWWSAVKRTALPPEWTRYVVEVGRCLRSVKAIAAPSQDMLESLRRNYELAPDAGQVIPNGRTSASFYEREKEPFILTAGRLWDEAKGVSTIAQAACELPWPVYLAGEEVSPEGTSFTRGECRTLDRLSSQQIADYYARASIYAHPARYEPFGLSVLEAALSRCALVLGDIASLREIWGDTAIFAPPDDPQAWVAALRKLIQSPLLCETMAQRSVVRARELTSERMASAYLNLYRYARTVSSRESYACAS